MSITHHIAVILIVFLRCNKSTSVNCVFFHTDYDDQHITALEHFLADILDSNQILPSCSNPGLNFFFGLN